jgi:hypothetical protein
LTCSLFVLDAYDDDPMIMLPPLRPPARHDAADREAEGGPPTTRPVFMPQAAQAGLRSGAPGGAAVRWRSFARSRSSPAAASGWASQTHPSGPRKPAQTRFARQSGVTHRLPPRGLANPWRLPALHSPRERETENGTGQPAALSKKGGAALAWVLPASCRGASPESRATSREVGTQTE